MNSHVLVSDWISFGANLSHAYSQMTTIIIISLIHLTLTIDNSTEKSYTAHLWLNNIMATLNGICKHQINTYNYG